MVTKGLDASLVAGRRQARNRSLRMAILTTVLARMSGALLQVVSLPIAAVQLGPAGFSVYAMLASLLAAMTLSNLGIGEATTLHMSRALATGETSTTRELFLASLSVVGGIATSVCALTALLILASPLLPLIFSHNLDQASALIGPVLFVCFVFLTTQVLSIFEAAQLALQRQHRLNIAIGIGSFLAAVTVWFVANAQPDMLSILIAVHLPVIIARTFNAAGVWADIRPRCRDFMAAQGHMREILKDGLRFVGGTTIANFLCHPFSVLVVGIFAMPLASASFAAVMNALVLASAFFAVVSTPMRAPLAEAFKIGDLHWIRQSAKRMLAANLALGLLGFLAFGVLGEHVFALWFQGAVAPSQATLWGAGAYILVLSIEVSNFIYLSSIGFLPIASRLTLLKAGITACCLAIPLSIGHPGLHYWVLATASVIVTIIPLGFVTITQTPINRKVANIAP